MNGMSFNSKAAVQLYFIEIWLKAFLTSTKRYTGYWNNVAFNARNDLEFLSQHPDHHLSREDETQQVSLHSSPSLPTTICSTRYSIQRWKFFFILIRLCTMPVWEGIHIFILHGPFKVSFILPYIKMQYCPSCTPLTLHGVYQTSLVPSVYYNVLLIINKYYLSLTTVL
jgi:hypothetical protein